MGFPLALATILLTASPGDWPEFRGPTAQGHSDEKGLPAGWSEEKNIAWKTVVPGRGWSSPVVKDGRIWLTTATEGDLSLRAVSFEAARGRVERDVEVFRLREPSRIHQKNTPASPTAVLDGDRVYVHFGKLGTACLSSGGEVLWRRNDLEFEHGHGPGGSPVAFQDLLIFSCDGTDRQFVIALDKKTGQTRWLTERKGSMAYTTPLVIEVGGAPQLVSPGGERVVAYDPRTGAEIWSSGYPGGFSLVCRPVFGNGLVFVSSGYDTPVLYAIRPDGKGDVTATHVAWSLQRGAPLNPSPLLVAEDLYLVSDRGILNCVDCRTGKLHFRQRLEGEYSASPVFADGKIYLQNEDGLTTVIAPGHEYRDRGRSQLDGRTLASLAVADGAIFLRTDRALYRIEEKRP